MPDLASILSSAVIFLFKEDGRTPIGTAFIVGYPVPDRSNVFIPIIVTAKHVVGDLQEITGRFTPKSGTPPISVSYKLEELRNRADIWEHPDKGVDLLAFRTPHFQQAEYQVLPLDLIASKKVFGNEDVKATDRVIFPCLLINFMGANRNYPITRDGSIALIPEELIPLEYKVGSKVIRTKQELILIDATSIPGASGSPVFLWSGPRLKKNTFAIGGTRPWLLGIMHGFYPAIPRELIGIQTGGVVPAYSENSGIAIVFPSWRLLEILELEDVAKRMQELSDSAGK